jgi:hypothetical protein
MREAKAMPRSPTLSILGGIVAPIACFALQPLLFLPGAPPVVPPLEFINVFWLFGYGVIGLEMLALAVWLAIGNRLGAWNGLFAGVLFAGALFAGGLGLVLLPFSVLGLMLVIGLLGFVPFLTAVVYCVNAVVAYRHAREFAGPKMLIGWALLGALLVIGVPGAVQAGVSLAVRSAISDVAAGNSTAMLTLRAWYRLAPRDSLVSSYAAERDPVRKQRLANAYKELTGEDVESRIAELRRLED